MPIATLTYIYGSKTSNLNLQDIVIWEELGRGRHGVVYAASLDGSTMKTFALKVFQSTPEAGDAFNRELKAYQRIMADENSKNDCPVVKAYAWFELPSNFSVTSTRNSRMQYVLSQQEPAKVLVKKVVQADAFDLANVPPKKMISHRCTLDRLQIYVRDYNRSNFKGGKLVDLSDATIELSDDEQVRQVRQLKLVVLRCYGKLDAMATENLDDKWAQFEEEAALNPNMLEMRQGYVAKSQVEE